MSAPAIKKVLARSLGLLPLPLWSKLIPRSRIAFTYHVVSDAEVEHLGALYPYKTERMFSDDLDYLMKYSEVVGYAEFLRSASDGRGQPEKPKALIAFDDGLTECHRVVRPLLLKRGLGAVFFITTDWLDNRQMFFRHKISCCVERLRHGDEAQGRSWVAAINVVLHTTYSDVGALSSHLLLMRSAEQLPQIDEMAGLLGIDFQQYLQERKPYLSTAQVQQLAADGFALGAHSLDHSDFRRLDASEIERQIVTSCQMVGELTGQKVVPFAFPYGVRGVNRRSLRELQRRHSIVGPLFGSQGLAVDPPIYHRLTVDSLAERRMVIPICRSSSEKRMLECLYRGWGGFLSEA